MHKCIMIKIGGNPKNKKNENRGKFINLSEIGDYAICIVGLGGMDAPGPMCTQIKWNVTFVGVCTNVCFN